MERRGDWDVSYRGFLGDPGRGDGVFDQQDIVAALQHGLYNQGPYASEADGVGGVDHASIRILNDPFQSFGELVGFEGIVGMPAMVNRVTTLDMSPSASGGFSGSDLSDLDSLIDVLSSGGVSSGMGVSFSHTLPPTNGHRYGVHATALHFDPDEPGAVPTAAPLPIVTVSHHLNGATATGDNYIIDTGAQLSFMSLSKARELGLDPDDPFSTIDIQGVGGTKKAPVFYIESLSIPTNEGVDLYWRDVQVIGLDLDPSIDGVIGSDLLTAGLLETDLSSFDLQNLLAVGEGPIQQVHFDFRNLDQPTKDGTGTMYLDLNPDFDRVRTGDFDPQLFVGEGEDVSDLIDLIDDLFGFTSIPGNPLQAFDSSHRSVSDVLLPVGAIVDDTLMHDTEAAEIGDSESVYVPEPSALCLAGCLVIAYLFSRCCLRFS